MAASFEVAIFCYLQFIIPSIMKLCFATNNSNKLGEIQALLGQSFDLTTLLEIGCTEDIPEPFDTIIENSSEKARYVWEKFGVNCFADDSGLEVTALNGEPGVLSARYAGPQKSHEDNMALLLDRLAPFENRSARFVTVITLVLDGNYHQFEGAVEGTIITTRCGTNGFGYDPIFVPDGFDKTFAEMDLDEKSKISHRAIAFGKLIKFLKQL
jgi:XTP/dITP diphosphohydrolase